MTGKNSFADDVRRTGRFSCSVRRSHRVTNSMRISIASGTSATREDQDAKSGTPHTLRNLTRADLHHIAVDNVQAQAERAAKLEAEAEAEAGF